MKISELQINTVERRVRCYVDVELDNHSYTDVTCA